MPLYVADYMADTAHLRAAESGAYMHLIMHYWRHGGLPHDDRQLAIIARMTSEEWTDARPLIEPFFKAGPWKHKRVEAELRKAEQKVEAGRNGGKAKAARQGKEASESLAETEKIASTPVVVTVPTEQSIDSEKKDSTDKEVKKDQCLRTRAREIIEVFETQFWPSYPKRKGANPKAPARKAFEAAVRRGADPVEIAGAARRYAIADADKIGTVYIAQAMTWLNQQRWGDYPEVVEATGPPLQNAGWQPGMRTRDEILASMGAGNGQSPKAQELVSGIGKGSGEGSGVRQEGSGIHEERTEVARRWAEGSNLPDHKPRKSGMASLGTVLHRIPGVRAACDAEDESKRAKEHDGSDRDAGMVR